MTLPPKKTTKFILLMSLVIFASQAHCSSSGDRPPVDISLPDARQPDARSADMAVPDKSPPDQHPPDLFEPDQYTGDLFITDFGAYVPGTWKFIPAGTFLMGSALSEPCRHTLEVQHKVTLTRSFWIMTTEVTQAQFKSQMGYNPSYPWSGNRTDHPVEQVTWHEAAAYANALSTWVAKELCYTCKGPGKDVLCSEAAKYSKNKIYACPGYRLPTESEWEYAYRAGTTTAFYNGNISNGSDCFKVDLNADKIAWYCVNSGGAPPASFGWPRKVGQKAPNAWGLYDMAGNVWEWCHDILAPYPAKSVTDPVGLWTASWKYTNTRGGGFSSNACNVRAARRVAIGTSRRKNVTGFRVVRSVL